MHFEDGFLAAAEGLNQTQIAKSAGDSRSSCEPSEGTLDRMLAKSVLYQTAEYFPSFLRAAVEEQSKSHSLRKICSCVTRGGIQTRHVKE